MAKNSKLVAGGPMATAFANSIFQDLIKGRSRTSARQIAIMGGITGSSFSSSTVIEDVPLVFFDFETTGLDTKAARIIEIGAVKFHNRQEIGRISTLINPGFQITPEITKVTGLTNADLTDAPPLKHELHRFHDFLRGCIGVAHNAEFDCNLLAYESARYGIQCAYTVLCTLRMARQLLDLPKRNLDALAEHYSLTFQSRHRSIGDIIVTAEVLWKMLDDNPHIRTLSDAAAFLEPVPTVS